MRTALLALACLLACAPIAHGASYVPLEQRLTPQQMDETGLSSLTAAQRAALDTILRGEADAAATANAVAAPVTSSTTAATPSPAAAPPRAPGPRIGLDDEPIAARAMGTIAGWEPGTVFTLDNGQRWAVLKGKVTLKAPRENPEILVIPSIAGRWFLQVDEDLPSARVYLVE